MASLPHMIRDMIVVAFEKGNESEILRNWRSAFAQTLLQDLEKDEKLSDFADMFAQTIAYGLFFARVMDDTSEDFSMEEAQRLIPKSNPFLRNFFYQITGPDLRDEPFWIFFPCTLNRRRCSGIVRSPFFRDRRIRASFEPFRRGIRYRSARGFSP